MGTAERGQSTRKRPVPYLRGGSREQSLLNAGRDVFLDGGWDLFNMERVAERLECSRSLVYAHFPSKEELLLALDIESKLKRLQLLDLTLRFQGRPRERMIAIDRMEMYLVERHLPIELFFTSARLRVKTSAERQQRLRELEQQTLAVGAGIVEEALANGDLPPLRHFTADQVYFALWSSVWGASSIQRSDFPYAESGIDRPAATTRVALLYMMDGFGWRPLTNEWDYRATSKRADEEIFNTEAFQAAVAENEPDPDA